MAGSVRELVFGKDPEKTLKNVLSLAALSVLVFHYTIVPIKVNGKSMAPSYQNGEANFVNRFSYISEEPKRNDVVVAKDEDDLILKRVLGLPGERVCINENGELLINGTVLRDRYGVGNAAVCMEEYVLGKDEYFIMGDNRAESMYKVTKRSEIEGRVVFER